MFNTNRYLSGRSERPGSIARCWLWAALLLAIFSAPCFARQDAVAPWTSLTLETKVQTIPMVVTDRVNGNKLDSIGVRYGKRTVQVPASALANIPLPQLHTLRVIVDAYDEIIWNSGKRPDEPIALRPAFYITFEYGPPFEIGKAPHPEREMVFATVDFHFVGGEFRERWFRKPTGRDKWQMEFDCRPEWRPKGAKPCSTNGPSM